MLVLVSSAYSLGALVLVLTLLKSRLFCRVFPHDIARSHLINRYLPKSK